jgi:hypothetical protein
VNWTLKQLVKNSYKFNPRGPVGFPETENSTTCRHHREPVERGSGRGYDEACRALVDIAEAYALFSTKKRFQEELKRFMGGHTRRKALIQRLVKAGIWKDQ